MAGGGYRGIHATVPTTQNLRSASRWGKRIKRSQPAAAPTLTGYTVNIVDGQKSL